MEKLSKVVSEQIKEDILSLIKDIKIHQDLYYINAKPKISDREYDNLVDELESLEKKYPEFIKKDSPTQKPGSDLDKNFPDYNHTVPVLSLDKCYSYSEIYSWIEKCRKNSDLELSFSAEEKIDGVSIVLYYKKGLLKAGVTRGNGIIGSDITKNIKTIKSIPQEISIKEDLAVRGEIYLSDSDFLELNKTSKTNYANPRNLTAGTIRKKDPKQVAKTPLQIFVYEGFSKEFELLEHSKILEILENNGFKTNPNVRFFDKNTDIETLENFVDNTTKQREKLNYGIDGIVFKICQMNVRESLGYTGHHPRWAIAYKFEAPKAVSIVENIIVQIGRGGRITPVAEIKPVLIAGSTVSRATLHNQDYIDELEICIGDTISISKRGDIIPAVEEVLEKNTLNNTIFLLPKKCPSCSLELTKNGAHLFCNNKKCPDIVLNSITYFAGKDGLDIETLGKSTIIEMIKTGKLLDVADIFSFDFSLLLNVDGFGEKKIKKLLAGITKSKNIGFEKLLPALAFKELGKRTVELLIDAGFDSYDKILNTANKNDSEIFSAINGMGDITSKLLIKQFTDPSNIALFVKLKNAGLKMEATPKKELSSNKFTEQTWCVTGSFINYNPRDKAKELIKQNGGKVTSSVSKKTTHLLAGDGAGSKLKKAVELNIKVITEDEFTNLLA